MVELPFKFLGYNKELVPVLCDNKEGEEKEPFDWLCVCLDPKDLGPLR